MANRGHKDGSHSELTKPRYNYGIFDTHIQVPFDSWETVTTATSAQYFGHNQLTGYSPAALTLVLQAFGPSKTPWHVKIVTSELCATLSSASCVRLYTP